MELSEVCRLSRSAALEDSLVISSPNLVQSTLMVMATNGSRMNAAPSPAGTNTQRGRPE